MLDEGDRDQLDRPTLQADMHAHSGADTDPYAIHAVRGMQMGITLGIRFGGTLILTHDQTQIMRVTSHCQCGQKKTDRSYSNIIYSPSLLLPLITIQQSPTRSRRRIFTTACDSYHIDTESHTPINNATTHTITHEKRIESSQGKSKANLNKRIGWAHSSRSGGVSS